MNRARRYFLLFFMLMSVLTLTGYKSHQFTPYTTGNLIENGHFDDGLNNWTVANTAVVESGLLQNLIDVPESGTVGGVRQSFDVPFGAAQIQLTINRSSCIGNVVNVFIRDPDGSILIGSKQTNYGVEVYTQTESGRAGTYTLGIDWLDFTSYDSGSECENGRETWVEYVTVNATTTQASNYTPWEPNEPSIDKDGYCVNGSFSSISSTGAVPVNLLKNPSFETGRVIPDEWSIEPALYGPSSWRSERAHEGNKHIFSSRQPQLVISQTVFSSIDDIDNYSFDAMLGGASVYISEPLTSLNGVHIYFADGFTTSLASDHSQGYSNLIESVTSVGLDFDFSITIPDTSSGGSVYVDSAYLVPVITSGGTVSGVDCTAVESFYGIVTIEETGGTALSGGNGCYICSQPSGILEWLNWLGCIISDWFCVVIDWLMVVANVLNTSNWFSRFADFVTLSSVNVYDYLSERIEADGDYMRLLFDVAVQQIIFSINPAAIVNGITSSIGSYLGDIVRESVVFDLIDVIGELLVVFFTIVFDAMSAIYNYVIVVNYAISNVLVSFDQPPLTIEEFTGQTEAELDYRATEESEGFSEGTIFLMLVWGLYLSDGWVLDFQLWPLVWIGHGAVALSAIIWFAREVGKTVTVSV